MKKIMFSDRYGLTDAVLQGRKTMTRRMVGNRMTEDDIKAYLKGYTELAGKAAPYKIGEVVAVAQSYQTILDTVFREDQQWMYGYMRDVEKSHEKMWEDIKGRTSKMYVKADLMPYQIRITDIKVERLQDISDGDCMKEGVYYNPNPPKWREHDHYEVWHPSIKPFKYTVVKDYCAAKFAFADLIDRVSGKGAWDSNPWVFAYSFELIK